MKKVKYPNLNDYDLFAYEELKGDILYRINGGTGAMTEADQAAMAEACKNGDKDKQAEILSKYEKKDDATTTPTNNNTPVAPTTTPQTTQPAVSTEPTQPTADPGSSTTKTTTTPTNSGNNSTGGANNYNGSTGNTGNTSQNNKDCPDFIDTQTKTINVNINSNKNIVQGYVAYKILSDKGYVFRLVDGSNVVHTFSSVEAVQNYIKAEAIIQEEKKVEVYVRRIEQDPNNYSIEAYQRKALAPYLRKKDVVATHSLYVINEKSTGVTSTLSFNGTGYTLYSEGAWKLNSKTDVEGWENYKNGFNNYDMEIFLSKEVINVKETAGKIIDSINSNTKYYALDHVFDKPNMENCNTALYSTVDYNHYGKK